MATGTLGTYLIKIYKQILPDEKDRIYGQRPQLFKLMKEKKLAWYQFNTNVEAKHRKALQQE